MRKPFPSVEGAATILFAALPNGCGNGSLSREGAQTSQVFEEDKAMIYKRGKQGTWWFRFRFAGRFIHESTRTRSKTLAREAERHRRRELEERINGIRRQRVRTRVRTPFRTRTRHPTPSTRHPE